MSCGEWKLSELIQSLVSWTATVNCPAVSGTIVDSAATKKESRLEHSKITQKHQSKIQNQMLFRSMLSHHTLINNEIKVKLNLLHDSNSFENKHTFSLKKILLFSFLL